MVIPFANGSTTYDGILPATRRDTSLFGCYCVADRLLRMTKRHDLRLVSSQKSTVSRSWLKREQYDAPLKQQLCVRAKSVFVGAW